MGPPLCFFDKIIAGTFSPQSDFSQVDSCLSFDGYQGFCSYKLSKMTATPGPANKLLLDGIP
jgi:hypothetical protein